MQRCFVTHSFILPSFTHSPLALLFLPHSLSPFPSLILSLLALPPLPSFPTLIHSFLTHSPLTHSFFFTHSPLLPHSHSFFPYSITPPLSHSLSLLSFPSLIHSFLTHSPHPLPFDTPSPPPPQVMDMDSERHRFVVSLCCSDLRHSNTGDPVVDGDWRDTLVGHLKRYLRQKVEAESGRTAHPIGAVRSARVCELCWDTDVAPVWGMCHMFGGCGTCLGDVAPVWGMWHMFGGCGTCLRDVAPVWGMWHLFGDT